MRTTILVLVMFTSVNALAIFHHKAKSDPALASIHKIYVKGNNETAVDLRRDMLKTATKYGDDSCFSVVGNEKAADAVLQISQHEASGGVNSLMGFGGGISTTVATGTLTDAKGNLLWSDSKQGAAGMIHSGGGSAALLLRFLHKGRSNQFLI